MSKQDSFGPNGAQVAKFIEGLNGLTPEERQELDTLHPFWVDSQQMQADLPAEAEAWLGAVMTEIHDVAGFKGIASFVSTHAASALAWADLIPTYQFALMYAHVRHLIPVAELGPGSAPSVYEQDAAVYGFASAIEDRRGHVREEERNYLLLFLSIVAAFVGAGGSYVTGGWAGLATFFSIATLFAISLWGQKFETSWTMPWRRN